MKNHKILIYICLLYLTTLCVSAQQYEDMSLSELKNVISYTESHLNSIGRSHGMMIIETIIDVSEKFNSKQKFHLKAHSYNALGKIYYSDKKYQEALKNYKIAELYVNQLEGFPKIAIKINNNIALSYLNGFNKPKKALRKIKHIYKNSNDINETSDHILALNLAAIYIKIRKYDKAFGQLEKCKKYFLKNKDISIQRLINTYTTYGEYYGKKREYQKAIKHYELAANLAEKNKLFRQAMVIYKNYENLLVRIGKKDKAYAILKKYTIHHQTALETEKLEADRYKKQLTVSKEKNTIETQKAQKSKTISIFTLSLLLLCLTLFCFFIYNHRKTKILGKHLAIKNKQLKIAKEKSDHLAAVKTKFISTISHELRTPLYGVVGLSSILMDKIKDEENFKFIKLMKFSADHLLNLINDVLQVTKMESYEISLDNSPYNIKNLADDIKNSFEYQADKNGNTLHLNFDPDIPNSLIGDSVRLSQIFINLISNANKFTKNGNIWLNFINPTITNNKVEITFEIKDDGRGIPIDKQEMIFDKFSQANSKDHTTGTGLGLHIVKNLVNLHGGQIKIKSKPGHGSTFYFTLSFEIDTKKEMNGKIDTTKKCISLTNTKDYKILIAEDNKINQIVTQNILKTKGYNSEIASDGLMALKMAKKTKYDLILMDLNMPNMNGLESTKKIREFDLNVCIIALTASDTQDTIKTIINPESGFNDFMRKPFKNEEFFIKIEANLNNTISKAS